MLARPALNPAMAKGARAALRRRATIPAHDRCDRKLAPAVRVVRAPARTHGRSDRVAPAGGAGRFDVRPRVRDVRLRAGGRSRLPRAGAGPARTRARAE